MLINQKAAECGSRPSPDAPLFVKLDASNYLIRSASMAASREGSPD